MTTVERRKPFVEKRKPLIKRHCHLATKERLYSVILALGFIVVAQLYFK